MEYQEVTPELSIKFKRSPDNPVRVKITSPAQAAKFFRSIFDADQIEWAEEFCVVYLCRSLTTIGYSKISHGNTSATAVNVKAIILYGIQLNASGIMVCHNHPSGSTKASDQDNSILIKLCKAARLFDMDVMDSIILTSKEYWSASENGVMKHIRENLLTKE